eukprot:5496616-Alexandrium_andersonii.AAC.1
MAAAGAAWVQQLAYARCQPPSPAACVQSHAGVASLGCHLLPPRLMHCLGAYVAQWMCRLR